MSSLVSILAERFSEFRSAFKEHHSHFSAGAAAHSSLLHVPEFSSPGAILKWGERARYRDFQADLPVARDECASVSGLDARTADAAFRSGMSLRFNPKRHFASLLRLHAAAAGDLGLLRTARAEILMYATPAGGQTNTHFDQNANFVVQLSGEKTWRVGAQDLCPFPPVRYSLSEGQPHYRLADITSELPTSRDEASFVGLVEHCLRPGDVLFVPPGHWHETYANSDSLQLNLTIWQPSVASVVALALQRHLERSPDWRAPCGVGDEHRITALLGSAGELLESFDATTAGQDADWMSCGPVPAETRYVRTGVAAQVQERTLLTRDGEQQVELTLSEALVGPAEHVLRSEFATLSELASCFPGVDPEALERLLDTLGEIGILAPESATVQL